MVSELEFVSEGSVLRGRLFTPDGKNPSPGIVMAPGFSATSHFAVFERYATAIAAIGVAVFLFDYRGFGPSEGEPRHEINAWNQARDYRSAVEFLRSLDQVDRNRVGIWGVSSSTAVASVVAAADPTIAAVVLLVPAFGEELSPPDPDGTVFNKIGETVLNTDLDSLDRTVVGPLPVVSADQLHSPSLVQTLTAFRWFIESGGSFGTGWKNQATLARLTAPAPFDAQVCIPHISAPILMVVAREDEESDADVARDVFATASEPKQLLTVDGGHFGVLYPDTREYELSASTQQSFLQEHLVT
ncbi:MAG: alpha/beta fold hydrolase [Acidobacteria bacterium]|nr:alpha/beta fold hydrolase [Acidobacteriota bacterium]